MPPFTMRKLTKEERALCQIITCEFRISHPHLFEPHAYKPTDTKRYSLTMLFPKGSDITGQFVTGYDPTSGIPLTAPRTFQEVVSAAKIAQFGPKENWPADLQSPFTDGDLPKFADKEGYPGHWVIKATANVDNRPAVVGPDGVKLTEASQIFPGCYARAFLYATVWEHSGKMGVKFCVDHVQKLRDGKSFGGKKSSDQVFAPIAPMPIGNDMDFT